MLLKIRSLQGIAVVFNITFILNVCRKYVGQVYCDSLVHDESALKYLVNTMGEVISNIIIMLMCSSCDHTVG